MIQSWWEAKGVEMILPSSIKSIEPGPALKRDDDSLTEYVLIIVATGVYSNIEFLEGSGIETDNGILVDAGLHTSVEDVFAAGDVAQLHLGGQETVFPGDADGADGNALELAHHHDLARAAAGFRWLRGGAVGQQEQRPGPAGGGQPRVGHKVV